MNRVSAQPKLMIEGSKASTMNGVPGSMRLHFSGPVETVFPDPTFMDVRLQLLLCTREIGMCNPRLYVL
jgi:hypothetical protein